jgi:quercetin dioxygenase-like cupin family protein
MVGDTRWTRNWSGPPGIDHGHVSLDDPAGSGNHGSATDGPSTTSRGDMSGYVLARDEGDAYDWRGARVVIKASGADTLGQLNVIDFRYPPGLSVPRHVHDGEDEMFYLLEGELQGLCDDEEWRAVPGTFVFVPRDRPHSLAVVGAAEAHGLVITGPAALDQSVTTNGVQVAHRP